MIEFFQFSLNLHCSWKIIENNYQYINTSSTNIDTNSNSISY